MCPINKYVGGRVESLSSTLNVVFSVTKFYLSCSILIVNRLCGVTTTIP